MTDPDPAPRAPTLDVLDNAVLSSLWMPTLSYVGGFVVSDNPNLAECLVDVLQAQVEAAQGTQLGTSSKGNNDACTCAEVDGVVEVSCD